MSEIRNAKITSTMLGVEDHGILTCFVHLSGDSWGVGFGGYALDQYSENEKRRRGTAYGMEFIRRLLATLDVETWEKLPGQVVRVDTEGWGGKALRIGHALKEQWFDPATLRNEYFAGTETEGG